jgi:23S rRNA pseudouridine1911/1915/1917 synthase
VQHLHTLRAGSAERPSQSIDVFLAGKLLKFSHNKIRNLLFKRTILVNGTAVDSGYLVQPNDVIEVYSPYAKESEAITPENIPLDIIYEEESFLILNKPAGMTVHRGLGNYRGTLLNALAYYFSRQETPVDVTGGLVHRLDKGTSGLMVFVKTKEARNYFEGLVKNRGLHRNYLALVHGNLETNDGVIDMPVGRNKDNPMVIQAFPSRNEGKEAVTHFKVIRRFPLATLVECRLETGRTHQIRIHMQHLGNAILGDPRYPSTAPHTVMKQILEAEGISHQLLHAHRLEFEHPLSRERCTFNANPGEDFDRVMKYMDI